MSQDRTRKIVVTGVMGAFSIILGLTHIGFLPWFSGTSLTVMHLPVIIGAILEGPWVGAIIGLIFGIFSLIQAAVAPNGPGDLIFVNPLLSILPRLFIGPIAWLVWRALKRWDVVAIIVGGIAGSLTNTILVLGMIVVLGYYPLVAVIPVALVNGLPEAGVSAFFTLSVIAVKWLIRIRKRQGANL